VRGEPIAGHGLFVMNTLEEIRQAFEDYQLGRMGEIADWTGFGVAAGHQRARF